MQPNPVCRRDQEHIKNTLHINIKHQQKHWHRSYQAFQPSITYTTEHEMLRSGEGIIMPNTLKRRLQREQFLIRKLQTLTPNGLNSI